MSQEMDDRQVRMAEAVRQIATRRERAPRSPRLERALKRLIWRYTSEQEEQRPSASDRAEAEKLEGDAGRETAGA